MPQHRELNARFKGYQARSRHLRTLGTSLLVVCVLVGTGLAFAKIAPDSGAIASLTNSLASTRSQLAAASSLPWLDGIGDAFYRTVCPLFKICPEETPAPIPQPQQPARLITTPPVATTSPRETQPARVAPSQPIQQTVINQPVIERIRETVRTVVESGLSPADLDGKLAALDAKLSNQISAVNTSAATNATTVTNVYETLGAVARIENLDDVNITNSRWSGGSIEGTSITGSISNAISSALATITDLTSTTITATNATTTNLYVSGETKLGSATGVLTSTSGVVSSLPFGANGLVLKIVAGVPSWATDISGGGGGSSAWATTSDDLAIYPSDTADVLLLGNNATTTTGNILEVTGNSLFRGALTAYNTLTASRFTATSSQASQFPYASSTALTVSGTGYFGTASTSNLTISGASGGLLKTSSAGVVSVASAGADYLSSASTNVGVAVIGRSSKTPAVA